MTSRPATSSPYDWHPYLREAPDAAACQQRVQEAVDAGVNFAVVLDLSEWAAANEREATQRSIKTASRSCP